MPAESRDVLLRTKILDMLVTHKIEEIAEELKVSKMTVYRLMNTDDFRVALHEKELLSLQRTATKLVHLAEQSADLMQRVFDEGYKLTPSEKFTIEIVSKRLGAMLETAQTNTRMAQMQERLKQLTS